jgi:Uncharacterised nucleotidyltransferase
MRGEVFAAAERLRIDAATAEILRAFGAAGVDSVLLKGPTLTSWLYRDGERRSYLDSDLLIRPGHELEAENTLKSLGFAPAWDESTLPNWWREHGSDWLRKADGVRVDLHRSLPGATAEPQLAWDVLTHELETVPVAGYDAPALGLPARALHVVLHAVQHGGDWGKGRGDLARALALVDDQTWRRTAELAARIDATDVFAAGLRLTPEGTRLADRMGLPTPASIDVALRAASAPPPVALGFEQLAQADSARARLAIGMRKLFPPKGFLVHWDPRAGESRGRLLLARIRRPFWLLARSPRGFRVWWRARREVRRR